MDLNLQNGIQILHLITGEDIIAGVEHDLTKEVSLSYPMLIVNQPTQDERTGEFKFNVMMWPYVMHAKDTKIRIRIRDIVLAYEANAEMYEEYGRQKGNGLVLPGKTPSLLLG
jgi:hypothetical protein